MITNEMIEAAIAKLHNGVAVTEAEMKSALIAALVLLPGEPEEWQYFCDGKWRHSTAPERHREIGYPIRPLYATPASDIAALREENERLRRTIDFVSLWAWSSDPPNASRNLTNEERFSAIKYHPEIKRAGPRT